MRTGRACVGALLTFTLVAAAFTTTSAFAAPSPARCAVQPTGVADDTIVVDGAPRGYRVVMPPAPPRGGAGLILNWHGFGSDAVEQAIYSQLEAKGPAAGYAVVTPQGTGRPAFWNIVPGLTRPDDVALGGALIDRLVATGCIDRHRVYATGISNGAGLSTLLGCRLRGRLAAIAPVAGVNLVAPCPNGPPLSVLSFHGNADPVVPFGGGSISLLPNETLVSVTTSVVGWAHRDGCATQPDIRLVTGHVVLTSYRRCRGGTQVELYTVDGGGHTWPGSLDLPLLGPTTHEINAADLILSFFSRHARPGG